MVQAGLEDWELSKIRVNLLQKADTSDLLNRLSMLQPLSSHRQSGERGALQSLFSRNSNQRSAPLRRSAISPCPLLCFENGSESALPVGPLNLHIRSRCNASCLLMNQQPDDVTHSFEWPAPWRQCLTGSRHRSARYQQFGFFHNQGPWAIAGCLDPCGGFRAAMSETKLGGAASTEEAYSRLVSDASFKNRTSCCRRTTSQPTSDNLGNLRKRIQEGTNASTKAPPSALKNTASAPPISREEWNITRPSLGAAKEAVARKLDAGKDEAIGHKSSSTPALAEAGRCMHHQASSEQSCADEQLRLQPAVCQGQFLAHGCVPVRHHALLLVSAAASCLARCTEFRATVPWATGLPEQPEKASELCG